MSTSQSCSIDGTGPCKCTRKAPLFFGIGIVGLLVAYYGAFFVGVPKHDFRPLYSLLMGSFFWLTILIGCLMMIMITRVFDAGWAPIIRRQWENLVVSIPVVLLLSVIPMAFYPAARKIVWEWTNPEEILPSGHAVAHDSIYNAKAWFLNLPFFQGRMIAYVVIFALLVFFLRKWSFAQDKDASAVHTQRLHNLSAVGIVIGALTLTFLAFDSIMALSYHWFSTMFGVWFFAAGIRACFAFSVVLCFLLGSRGWLKGIYNQAHRHILGCLLLAFTVFWAYISFSQYFLIYNANIPEETFWYNMREFSTVLIDGQWVNVKNQWWWVSLGLVFGHFFFPFLYLLFYRSKIVPGRILFISLWTLAFTLLDLYFNIVPRQIVDTARPEGFRVNDFIDMSMLLDVAAIVGFGGIVFGIFLRSSAKHEPIPIHDPRINESINYHE
ncbi:MAG: hypothetical protein LBV12_04435 [Puniceicoccales bacterium]|jgi:hypothetical protein|nr:hypothetical protein [Puniceicoccales bacterium]